MTRTVPKWNFEPAPQFDEVPLPTTVKKRLEIALRDFERPRVKAFIGGMPELIAEFHGVEAASDCEPTKRQKVVAAQQIAADARALAEKLPFCGGADLAIDYASRKKQPLDRSIEEMKSDLERLSSTAEAAAEMLEASDGKMPGPRTPKERLAARLAEMYMANLEERPGTTVERENSTNHPYVEMLTVLIEHCTGRSTSPHAVERFARAGTAALGGWRFILGRRGTKRVPK